MRYRKIILFLCILPWFVSTSTTFCQTSQAVRVRGFYANDSLKVRAYQDTVFLHSAGIGSPGIVPGKSAGVGVQVQPSVIPLDPNKCQWIRFHFSGTCWNWFIRKPGTYSGQVLVGSIQSNGKVLVEFKRFNNLECTDGSGGHLQTFYAVSSPSCNIGDLSWKNPDQFNAYCIHFNKPPLVPALWALWQKLLVGNSTHSAEFKDDGTICIQLLNNDIWIDGLNIEQFLLDQ